MSAANTVGHVRNLLSLQFSVAMSYRTVVLQECVCAAITGTSQGPHAARKRPTELFSPACSPPGSSRYPCMSAHNTVFHVRTLLLVSVQCYSQLLNGGPAGMCLCRNDCYFRGPHVASKRPTDLCSPACSPRGSSYSPGMSAHSTGCQVRTLLLLSIQNCGQLLKRWSRRYVSVSQ